MIQYFVPNYYDQFHCIAGDCRHTCCIGWEIDVDEDAQARYRALPDITQNIQWSHQPQMRLSSDERCPFLREDGLCQMICTYGENMLCQICRDHPRFRNYWTFREEIGLGLVCEEAARIILSSPLPMTLHQQDTSSLPNPLPEDEEWLWKLREQKLSEITEVGPCARLKEYLFFRHLPNALYDDRLEERLQFIEDSYNEIMESWKKTDGTLASLVEIARVWSYNTEYDDEVIDKKLDDIHRKLETKGSQIK